MCGRNKTSKSTVDEGVRRLSMNSYSLKATGKGGEKSQYAVHKGSRDATEMSDGSDQQPRQESDTC